MFNETKTIASIEALGVMTICNFKWGNRVKFSPFATVVEIKMSLLVFFLLLNCGAVRLVLESARYFFHYSLSCCSSEDSYSAIGVYLV